MRAQQCVELVRTCNWRTIRFQWALGGGTANDGACDQLVECCSTLKGQDGETCKMTAAQLWTGGDAACKQALIEFCGNDMQP